MDATLADAGWTDTLGNCAKLPAARPAMSCLILKAMTRPSVSTRCEHCDVMASTGPDVHNALSQGRGQALGLWRETVVRRQWETSLAWVNADAGGRLLTHLSLARLIGPSTVGWLLAAIHWGRGSGR